VKGADTLSLTLVEIVLNVLLVMMFLYLVVLGDTTATKDAAIHEKQSLLGGIKEEGVRRRNLERRLEVMSHERSQLEAVAAELNARAASLEVQVEKLGRGAWSELPSCKGGPIFTMHIVGANDFRVGERVWTTENLWARYGGKITRAREGQSGVPPCVYDVIATMRDGLPATDIIETQRRLRPYFRVHVPKPSVER